MKKQLSILILLFLSFFGYGQDNQTNYGQKKVDSLNYIIQNERLQDTVRISSLLALSDYFYKENDAEQLFETYERGIQLIADSKISEVDSKKRLLDFKTYKGLSFLIDRKLDLSLDIFEANLLESEKINDEENLVSNRFYLGLTYTKKHDYDKAIFHLNQCAELLEKNKDKNGYLVKCYSHLGISYAQLGDTNTSLTFFEKTLKINRETGPEKLIALSLNNIGIVHRNMGDNYKALKYLTESVELDKDNAASSYNVIASIYSTLKDTIKSKEYFNKSIDLGKKNEDHYILAINYVGIGNLYFDHKNFDKSLSYYIKGLEEYEKDKNIYGVTLSYGNIGGVYIQLEDYTKAETKVLESLSLARKHNYRALESTALTYLGICLKEKKEFLPAIARLKESLQLVEGTDLKKTINAYKHLSSTYERMGNYEEAYNAVGKYHFYRDSLFNAREIRKIGELEASYKFEKEKFIQENKIEILEKDKKIQEAKLYNRTLIIYSGIGFFLLLVGFGFYAFKNFRSKQRFKDVSQNLHNLKLQQRFLRTQLNPHFFFHALASIENHIRNHKRDESAVFLQNFSKLMRDILESSDVDFITLQEDMDFIERYLELQRLNQNFAFDFDISLDSDLEMDKIFIPPMLTQPLIENAIIHGALQVENGVVHIHCYKENNNLIIKIKDNGGGTTQTTQDSKKLHRSMSINIVKQRIQNLQKTYKITINYEVVSHEQHRTVTFIFPLLFDLPITSRKS